MTKMPTQSTIRTQTRTATTFAVAEMTLRDYLAGQALAGINIDDMMPSKNAAVWAYEIADAMLAERDK